YEVLSTVSRYGCRREVHLVFMLTHRQCKSSTVDGGDRKETKLDNEFDPNAKKKWGNSLISWSRQTSHHRLLSVNVALPFSWRHVTGTRGSRLGSNHPSQRSRLATTTVKIYLFIFRRKESLSL
ncbi:Uncharacterized protein TCM_004272 isoform 2, partial [Theobroma cacao]